MSQRKQTYKSIVTKKKRRKLGWPPTSTLEHNKLPLQISKEGWPKDYIPNQTAVQI